MSGMMKPGLCCDAPALHITWLIGVGKEDQEEGIRGDVFLRLEEVYCMKCKKSYRFDNNNGRLTVFRDDDKMAVDISLKLGRWERVQ